jgi:hypothetical protein
VDRIIVHHSYGHSFVSALAVYQIKSQEMELKIKNVEIETKDGKMIITVDLSKEFGLSKSGKTIIIASTEGNQKHGDVFIGLNIYKFPSADVQ